MRGGGSGGEEPEVDSSSGAGETASGRSATTTAGSARSG